jgi:antitoxin PrlF
MTIVENLSTTTSKGQVTIPIAVRKALDISPGDRLIFSVLEPGVVKMKKAPIQEILGESEGMDPAVAAYLSFLQQDMIANPQSLTVLQKDPEITKLLASVELGEDWLD